jgi:hypothetical protein
MSSPAQWRWSLLVLAGHEQAGSGVHSCARLAHNPVRA